MKNVNKKQKQNCDDEAKKTFLISLTKLCQSKNQNRHQHFETIF